MSIDRRQNFFLLSNWLTLKPRFNESEKTKDFVLHSKGFVTEAVKGRFIMNLMRDLESSSLLQKFRY